MRNTFNTSYEIVKTFKSIIVLFAFCSSFTVFAQNKLSHTIFFDSNQSQVIKSEKSKLLQFSDSISNIYILDSINLIGSCDDIGTYDDNKILSSKRTNNVANILRPIFTHANINNKSIGEKPLSANSKISINRQRELNRVVIIEFEVKEKEIKIIEKKIDDELVKKTFKQPLQKGDKIALPGILFEGGQDIFLLESLPWLDSLTTALIEHPKYIVQIQGHIYNPGNPALPFHRDNQTLSECRAEKVMLYLIENGIEKERLSFVGYEGYFPLHRQPKFDRRVEIEIIDFNE